MNASGENLKARKFRGKKKFRVAYRHANELWPVTQLSHSKMIKQITVPVRVLYNHSFTKYVRMIFGFDFFFLYFDVVVFFLLYFDLTLVIVYKFFKLSSILI